MEAGQVAPLPSETDAPADESLREAATAHQAIGRPRPDPPGRVSTRSEASPADTLIAAWSAGRMLSRLNWDLQLGVLRRNGSIDHFLGTPPTWSLDAWIEEFIETARRLVESVESKDELEAGVRSEWRSIQQAWELAGEAGHRHVFDVLDANAELVRFGRGVPSLRLFHDRICERLVGEAVALVDRLRQAVESGIGSVKSGALRLGELVDQGLHTRDVFRLTYEEPPDFDDLPLEGSSPSADAWWLATKRPSPGETLPDYSWLRRIEVRWHELGIPEQLPEAFLGLRSGQLAWAQIGDIAGLIASIERAALVGLGQLDLAVASINQPIEENVLELDGDVTIAPDSLTSAVALAGRREVQPGYLGFIMDEERRIVSREGFDASVNLSKCPLDWEILKAVLSKSGEVCHYEMLKKCWLRAGENEPDSGAMRQAVSVLRCRIGFKLGVQIRSEKLLGYWIENIM